MPRIAAVLLAAAALLTAPSAANAAHLTTTPAQGDRAAAAELHAVVGAADEDTDPGDTATSFDLDPCEQTGRTATCEFTIYYASGDACDGDAIVRYTRRGRLVVSLDEYSCDSDDFDPDATSESSN